MAAAMVPKAAAMVPQAAAMVPPATAMVPQAAATIHTVSSPHEVQSALATHLGPVYQRKHCDVAAAKTLLNVYRNRHADFIEGFSQCDLPMDI